MRAILRFVGFGAAFLSVASLLLAVAAWPPGGLMFALPYFFILAGVAFGLVGAVLIVVAAGLTLAAGSYQPFLYFRF